MQGRGHDRSCTGHPPRPVRARVSTHGPTPEASPRQHRGARGSSPTPRVSLFETEWSPVLAELAGELEIVRLRRTLLAFRDHLAHGLGPASAQLESLRGRFSALLEPALHEQFVHVREVAAQWATLDVLTPAFSASLAQLHTEQLKPFNDAIAQLTEPLRQSLAEASLPLQAAAAQLAVDSVLPLNAGLGVGDLALLRVEHSQGVSFVSLLAAVADTIEDADLDPATSAYFSEEPLPPAVRADIEVRRSAGDTVVVPPSVVALAS